MRDLIPRRHHLSRDLLPLVGAQIQHALLKRNRDAERESPAVEATKHVITGAPRERGRSEAGHCDEATYETYRAAFATKCRIPDRHTLRGYTTDCIRKRGDPIPGGLSAEVEEKCSRHFRR